MLQVGICDDNRRLSEELKSMLEILPKAKLVVKCFASDEELIEYLEEEQHLDVVLMDILLEDADGVEAAKQIQNLYPGIQIIFITGYPKQSERIFEAEPVDLILKPVTQEKLNEAFARVKKRIEEDRKQSITVTQQNSLIQLKISEIYYVESERRILHIHTTKKVWDVYMKLDEFMDMSHNCFVRCHKSFAVNMDKISHFGYRQMELANGLLVPVSRYKYKEAKESFLKYCGL